MRGDCVTLNESTGTFSRRRCFFSPQRFSSMILNKLFFCKLGRKLTPLKLTSPQSFIFFPLGQQFQQDSCSPCAAIPVSASAQRATNQSNGARQLHSRVGSPKEQQGWWSIEGASPEHRQSDMGRVSSNFQIFFKKETHENKWKI